MPTSRLAFVALIMTVAQWMLPDAARASLSLADREEIAEIGRSRPSIDLELTFESRSWKIRIRSSAFTALSAVGRALTDPSLKASVFVIAGHSAPEGRSEAYSQGLSERRADAVKHFLVENFDIDPARLVTVGYGLSKPKNPDDPYATENQRVQIVNMETAAPK